LAVGLYPNPLGDSQHSPEPLAVFRDGALGPEKEEREGRE